MQGGEDCYIVIQFKQFLTVLSSNEVDLELDLLRHST